MAKDKAIRGKKEQQMCTILLSDDQLTGRAGLGVFVSELHNISLFPIIERKFGTIRAKAARFWRSPSCSCIFLSFFMDGTSWHLNWKKKRPGHEEWLDAGTHLGIYHDRGTDQLTNRALKTFGHEQLHHSSASMPMPHGTS